MTQQGMVPLPGVAAHPTRNYATEQSAKLNIEDTGTTITAGQTMSLGRRQKAAQIRRRAEAPGTASTSPARSGGDGAGNHNQKYQRGLQTKLVTPR